MPGEIEVKDYLDEIVAAIRHDQGLIRTDLKVAIERIGFALEKLEATVVAGANNHEKRITILERAWANYQGRFWALGVGLGIVIILANFVFARYLA